MQRLIKSNATGQEQWVSDETWQNLVGLGSATLFTVLETKEGPTAEPVTETPTEVVDEIERRSDKQRK